MAWTSDEALAADAIDHRGCLGRQRAPDLVDTLLVKIREVAGTPPPGGAFRTDGVRLPRA